MCIISLVNWINKPQGIVEGKEKTSASFRRGNYNKIFFIRNPYKNPNERRKI